MTDSYIPTFAIPVDGLGNLSNHSAAHLQEKVSSKTSSFKEISECIVKLR